MDPKPFKSHKENEKADLAARKLADVTAMRSNVHTYICRCQEAEREASRRGYISCSMDRKKKASVRLLGSAPKK